MTEAAAGWIVSGFALYALTGLLFAIAFQVRILSRMDPAAHGAGLAFRLLISPGMVALWPLLLRRLWERRA